MKTGYKNQWVALLYRELKAFASFCVTYWVLVHALPLERLAFWELCLFYALLTPIWRLVILPLSARCVAFLRDAK